MKNLRMLLSIVVIAFLCLGYAASQMAAFNGTATEFASKIDQPPVQWLALFLLVVSIVLAFIKDREADEQ